MKYGGYDISQVLEMTIAEALALFQDVPAARARLALMDETGLGYLQLGQPASSFSGGEAQRVKLARELGRRGEGRTLYLLDEPTTGLHPADTARLLALLQRLVDAGNTVMVHRAQPGRDQGGGLGDRPGAGGRCGRRAGDCGGDAGDGGAGGGVVYGRTAEEESCGGV